MVVRRASETVVFTSASSHMSLERCARYFTSSRNIQVNIDSSTGAVLVTININSASRYVACTFQVYTYVGVVCVSVVCHYQLQLTVHVTRYMTSYRHGYYRLTTGCRYESPPWMNAARWW